MGRTMLNGEKKAELIKDIRSGMEDDLILELYEIKQSTLKKIRSELIIADEDVVIGMIEGGGYSSKEIAEGLGVSLTHVEALAVLSDKRDWLDSFKPKKEEKTTKKKVLKKHTITLKIEGGEELEKLIFPDQITINLIVKGE